MNRSVLLSAPLLLLLFEPDCRFSLGYLCIFSFHVLIIFFFSFCPTQGYFCSVLNMFVFLILSLLIYLIYICFFTLFIRVCMCLIDRYYCIIILAYDALCDCRSKRTGKLNYNPSFRSFIVIKIAQSRYNNISIDLLI